jgi:hypothetical protein
MESANFTSCVERKALTAHMIADTIIKANAGITPDLPRNATTIPNLKDPTTGQ